MHKLNFLIFVFLVYCINIIAFTGSRVNIDSVVNKANAVIISESSTLTITGINDADLYVHKKILIKSKNAENYCSVYLVQTEFRDISDIKAFITDTLGNVIKTLDDDDIKTAEVIPGYSYYSNEMHRIFSLKYNKYPYVFEYSYREKINSLFFWPDWHPQHDIPCLSSVYKLILEKPLKFNFHKIGEVGEPAIAVNDGVTVYTWKGKDIPEKSDEDFIPPEDKIRMAVLFTPLNFSLKGYKGNFSDWKSIGNWYNELTKGRYELSAKAKNEVTQLVENAKTTKEKISILYKYLQNKNHYVDIEFGISGWQPQSAEEVYTNRYGDCKDLTTFMVAILKSAGIKSYPALALTRDRGEVIKDFPSNQFNHCIAFVPLKNDSLWIECTASFMNLGDTPPAIQGINALVVTETGGKIVQTPVRKSAENLWISKSICNLENQGDMSFTTSLSLAGNQKDYLKPYLSYNNDDDRSSLLKRYFGSHYSGIEINKYTIKNEESSKGRYTVKVEGSYHEIIQGIGKLVLINPNLYNRQNPDWLPEESVEDRKFPVYFNFPYEDIDSVEIKVPGNFKLDALPERVYIEEPFGRFSAEYSFNEGKILYSRKFELTMREIPLKYYKDYRDFIQTVIKKDNSQIVFRR